MSLRQHLLISLISAFAMQTATASGPTDELKPATFSYYKEINNIVVQRVVQALVAHIGLADKSLITITFRVDGSGNLKDLRVASSSANRYFERTSLRAVQSLKLPAMPKPVIAEQGHNWMDINIEINISDIIYQKT
jgi:TonB family protein